MAWKEDKIAKFLEVVRDVKITLLLTRQNSIRYYHSPGMDCSANLSSRATLAHPDSHRHDLATITDGMRMLLQEQPSRVVTTTSAQCLDLTDHMAALGKKPRTRLPRCRILLQDLDSRTHWRGPKLVKLRSNRISAMVYSPIHPEILDIVTSVIREHITTPPGIYSGLYTHIYYFECSLEHVYRRRFR